MITTRLIFSKIDFLQTPDVILYLTYDNFVRFSLTREHIQLGIADFDKIWHERSFRKNIRPVFFFYLPWLMLKG